MLFWLLLPLAAFSGWWIGRTGQNNPTAPQQKLTHGYLTGLNFLLNEQPDKAVDLFIKMLAVDSETVETHLALGSLFRRRGEVDKAIRIHQNLIARPHLSQKHRMQSLYELGTDYLSAGVLDRAESLFLELVKLNHFVPESLKQLLQLYEKEGDFEKAIDIAQKYQLFCAHSMQETIAHYYCELAEQSIKSNQMESALRYIKKAQSIDALNVRAQILHAQQLLRQKEYKEALRTFFKVNARAPEYLQEIVAPICECFEALGDLPGLKNFISQCIQDQRGLALLMALPPQWDEAFLHPELTSDHMIKELESKPSLRALQVVMSMRAKNAKPDCHEDLNFVLRVLKPLQNKEMLYHCEHCGYAASRLYWHCPSCHHWGSIKPFMLYNKAMS